MRIDCSPRVAIRARIVNRSRGMFSSRRSTRANVRPRARNVPLARHYACGSLAARAECRPRAAMRVRIVDRARRMVCPHDNTRADRWPRARDVFRAPQYAGGSPAARMKHSPRAATHMPAERHQPPTAQGVWGFPRTRGGLFGSFPFRMLWKFRGEPYRA